jgi:predicted nucleic acid-binding protein
VIRVVIDTNVFLDVFLAREGLKESSGKVLDLAANHDILGIIPAHIIPTLYFFISKEKSHDIAIELIKDMLDTFKIGEISGKLFGSALKLKFSDYEDAICAEIAHRENCEFIITNNIKDFKKSIIPAVNPKKFLSNFESG